MIEFTQNPITEIHANMNFADYLSAPGINRSMLRAIDPGRGGCPAKFRAAIYRPETEAKRFGSLYHMALLDPEEFGRVAITLTAEMKDAMLSLAIARGSKAKGFSKGLVTWKEFTAEHPDSIILSEREGYEVRDMSTALWARGDIRKLLGKADYKEVTAFAGYKTGSGTLQLKARPDAISGKTLVDLKTCETACPQKFAGAIVSYGYDIQAALYLYCCRAAGLDVDEFAFIAQEKRPPYACGLYYMPIDWMAYAARKVDALLNAVATCIERNHWPDFGASTIDPPAWLEKEISA